MIRIGLRDARAHMRRFVMSIIAIALGVSFVVGSFCFREMLNDQVSQMMGTNSDHDVYVRGATEQKNDADSTSSTSSSSITTYNEISTDLVKSLEKVKGVASASVTYSISGVVLLDHDGNAVSTVGAPTLLIGADAQQPWRSAHFVSGSYAKTDSEVALNEEAANKAGVTTGDSTRIVIDGEPHDVTVSGVFSTSNSQLGALLVLGQPSMVEHYLQQEGTSTTQTQYIGIYGNDSTPLTQDEQQQLADRVNAALAKDDDAHAITGDSLRDEETKSTQDALGFIQPLILIFAAIALFVGAFIIANTFTMIVRDSMRGYALLRSVGASPAQVFGTVIIQAVILGLVGSVLGVLLGWGLLELIAWALSNNGMPLSGSPAPSATDVAIGMIVGIVVTIIGATLPARTAATAPPIQAMNETVNPEKPVAKRGRLGFIMVIVGSVFWVLCWMLNAQKVQWSWLDTLGTGWTLGLGAAFVVIGVIVVSPAFVTAAAKVLGWIPTLIFPVTGKLATRNIGRAKRRTANTAAALFVGVAIVSCLGVVASSMKGSVSDMIDNNLHADYVLTSASMAQPISQKAADAVEKTEGVGATSTIRLLPTVSAKDAKKTTFTAVINTDLVTKLYPIDKQEGDTAKALSNGEAAIGKNVADDEGWKIGDTIELTSKNTEVDEEATAEAIKAYQNKVETQAMTLQEEAQKLALSGDAAGAQQKAQEAQNVVKQAQHVDQKQFVKTKEVTKTEKVKIGAIIDESVYMDNIFVSEDTAKKLCDTNMMLITQMYVQAKSGTNLETLRTNLQKAVKPYYTITVMDRDSFKSTMSTMINTMLSIIYALLALSIIIAIFGIVNTLALNVSERTKEIGLLRAIGTSNGQIRGMIAIESVILSVFGTLLGIITGVAAGVVIREAYKAQGLNTLSIPWGQLVLFLLLSIVIGLIASISPASRALKQPVLDAVASE